ncbi:MAG TPA: erythromycin esterase family protein [Thermoanaerobaculia bacterium]
MKVVLLLSLLLAVPVLAQSDAAFVDWAQSRITPIDAKGAAFRTLDPAIARARLIGVGESVHDSEPFLSFRTQLLQDLVRRHRVTALVLESGLPEALALDDYVRGKTAAVDYDAVLPGGFGSLEEIRRAMEWLRAWNLGEGKAHPVGVYGADLPARSGSMVPALDRLLELTAGDAVVQSLVDAIRPVAVQTAAGWWKGAADKYGALPPEAKAGLARDVSLLVQRVHLLSREDARLMATVLQQNEAVLRLGMFDPTVPRDLALADNTLAVLRRLGPGERAVYWAHNAHVQRVLIQGAALPPGTFLGSGRRFDVVLGDQYVAIATAYGGPSRDNASAPTEGSLDAALGKVGKGPFLLTLRGDVPPAAAAWLSAERPMRFQAGYLDLMPGKAFDAVVYFEGATRAARVAK